MINTGMKRIKTLGLVTTCATLLLLAFMISVVYSAQNVSFGLLEDFDISWRDGNVAISMPFYVKNRGFYDIEDIDIFFQLGDSGGQTLAESAISLGAIRAGSKRIEYLNVTLNPITLLLKGFLYELLQNKPIELKAKASLNYALSWLRLEAEANITLTPSSLAKGLLRSLAKDFSINLGNPTIKFNDTDVAVNLPVSLNYTGWFPIQNLQLKLEAKNSTGFILGTGEIIFDRLKPGQIEAPINITCNKELIALQFTHISNITIYFKTNLAGFTFEWIEDISLNAMKQS